MECNCSNTGAKIRHVYGNVLRIAVPLTLRTVEVVDGVITATDTDFTPCADYPVSILLDRGEAQVKFIAQLRGENIAYFEDKGTLPVGTYSITVLCKDDQGNPYRFKERAVLRVVDCTADAGVQPGIEYEDEEYYLDNAVFFASGSADRGIDHIKTTTDADVVTVTFYLTDGTTESFQVVTGLDLVVDQDWDINSENAIANKVVTGFRNEVVDTLATKSSVAGETLTLRW